MPDDGRRYTIVQIVNSLALAGAERVTISLAKRLDPSKWDVHVVIVRDGVLRETAEDAGIPVYKTGHSFDHTAPFAVFKMLMYLRRVKPDIVHTHLLGSDVVGRLAALLAGVPIVISTQHDMQERAWYYNLYRRVTGRMIAATVACSSAVAAYCRDAMRIPVDRLREIDNGVDVDAFARAITPMRSPVTFGAVGSLIPLKGHQSLIEAFAMVRERIPGARLRIAGEGTERAALEETIARLGLGDVVELPGIVRDVPAFLRETDVFVLPSLTEGLPMALLEAMAASKPSIVSDISTLKELLCHGECGVLVPAGDVEALGEALVDVAQNPEVAEVLGSRARQQVAQWHSLDRMAAAYEELYRNLISERASKGSQGRGREARWWRVTRGVAQVGLLGAVAYFVAVALSSGFREARFDQLDLRFDRLALSVGILVAYYLSFIGGLVLLLRANGQRVSYMDVFKMSFVSNLGKYLPGGIWPIAGRVSLAGRIGLPSRVILVVSIVESAASVAGGALAIALVGLLGADMPGLPSSAVSFGVVVAILASLHPAVFGRLVALVSGFLDIDSESFSMTWGATLGIVVYYAGTWFVAGAAFHQFTSSIVPDLGGSVLPYTAIYAFGAIVGLLVLFAPGGIGAREGALLVALTGWIGAPAAAVISVTARLWSTIIELVLSVLALVIPFGMRSGRRGW